MAQKVRSLVSIPRIVCAAGSGALCHAAHGKHAGGALVHLRAEGCAAGSTDNSVVLDITFYLFADNDESGTAIAVNKHSAAP